MGNKYYFNIAKTGVSVGLVRFAEDAEKGGFDASLFQRVMQKHMVDADGKSMPKDEVEELVDNLAGDELIDAITQLVEAIKEAAVPPQNGTD